MERPVCSRTRSREALLFRKMHQEIRKKKHENGSSSSPSRDIKISSNSSANSFSFGGFEKFQGKDKRKRTTNWCVSGYSQNCSVKDSNLGSSDFDLGYSGNRKFSPLMEVEESCSGPKFGNFRIFDSQDNEDSGVIHIPDSSLDLSTDSESEHVTVVPSDDDFQISPSSEEDEDYKGQKEYFTNITESDKRKKLEPPLRKKKRFQISSDTEDEEHEEDVKVVEVMSKKNKKLKSRNSRIDIVDILGNSMFNEDEEEQEEDVIVEPESPILRQKFLFGVQVPLVVEKTAAEIEEEQLWAEMNLALCGEDSTYNAQVLYEADSSTNVETTVAEDCSQGKHVLILDEQIGVICKNCGFVQQEIRHYTVPFNKNPFGRSDRRGSYRGEFDNFGKFHLHEFENDESENPDIEYNVRGKVWDIVPGLRKDLHPHQRDGFEFLWRNIGGSIDLDKLKGQPTSFDKPSGCIISHAPGTGKTRLAIVFIQSYMRMYPNCKPVIIAPCGMLLYWESEFKKWDVKIPFHNLNNQKLSRKENETALKMVRNKKMDRATVRMVKLYSWKKDRSVLALSYKLFEELVGDDKKGKNKTRDSKVQQQKALLEVPNLLILDEGHMPRNDQSLIWKALSKIHTTKRIILSGTPFQNNFDELYNTICLARPQFADLFANESDECISNRRIKHSAKKKWNSLTSPIGKDETNCKQKGIRLEKVRDLISPFVHVYEGNILDHKLPGLRSAAVILQPCEFQMKLLDKVKEEESLPHFEREYLVSLLSVHPSLMPEKCDRFERLKLDSDAGVKTKFLMELVRISVHLNEKVLVFSQYIEPLKLIGKQLNQRFRWIEGKEILCMDGSTEPANRQTMIKNFNNFRNESKVMLASTKACCEGINLVGASRVVLLDVVWNPSVERQAISRAYRLGQTKVVYIYHLLTSGTMEEDKYCRQARKEKLSELVFYSSDRAQNHGKLLTEICDDKKDKILESMVDGNKLKEILKKIIYEPKANFNSSFGLPSL